MPEDITHPMTRGQIMHHMDGFVFSSSAAALSVNLLGKTALALMDERDAANASHCISTEILEAQRDAAQALVDDDQARFMQFYDAMVEKCHTIAAQRDHARRRQKTAEEDMAALVEGRDRLRALVETLSDAVYEVGGCNVSHGHCLTHNYAARAVPGRACACRAGSRPRGRGGVMTKRKECLQCRGRGTMCYSDGEASWTGPCGVCNGSGGRQRKWAPKRRWTRADEDYLERRYDSDGADAVARRLGRSVAAVRKRASVLGVSCGGESNQHDLPSWARWGDR